MVDYFGGELIFHANFLRLQTVEDMKYFIETRLKEASVWEEDKKGRCGAYIASLERKIEELKIGTKITISSLVSNLFLGHGEPVTFKLEADICSIKDCMFYITCNDMVTIRLSKGFRCPNCVRDDYATVRCSLTFEVVDASREIIGTVEKSLAQQYTFSIRFIHNN